NTVRTELNSVTISILDITKTIVETNLPDNWDQLSLEDRINLLENLDKNFTEKFQELYKTKYKAKNNGEKAKIGLRLFRKLENRFHTRTREEIINDVLGGKNWEPVIASMNKRLDENFEPLPSTVSLKDNLMMELTLIDEKIVSENLKKKEGASANRMDRVILTEIYLALSGGVYDKIFFVTNDYDPFIIYNDLKNSLENSRNKQDTQGGSDKWRQVAERVLDKLGNLRIVNLSEGEVIFGSGI
ncbi:MAG: hypothetical protein QW665_09500, partial [Metallosphaera sp.]